MLRDPRQHCRRPGWLSSDLFDVVGKVPDGNTLATANFML